VLLYGTGGLAWTRFVQESVSAFAGGGSFGNTSPIWEFGWVAGVGGEVSCGTATGSCASNICTTTSRFGNFFETVTGPVNVSLSSTTGHLTADVVRTGLSYKFD
jgi:hypothetical protein